MSDIASTERRALLRSIGASAVLGSLGVAWGVVSGSQMILLDGVYAIIGIGTSWMLLRASALAVQGPSRRYPFGREAATPLVIGIQGVVLLGTLVYAAVEALFAIARGGSDVQAGPAVLYGAIITAASLGFWLWLRREAATVGSDVLIAEATAWRIAALRGVGMLVGFSIMALLIRSGLGSIAPFVDPAMVVLTCVLFIGAPLRMVRSTLLELLEASPPEPLRSLVQDAVDATAATFELVPAPTIRMTKLGPKLYLEVEGTARPDATIAEEHQVREDLRRRLAGLLVDVWLNLELIPVGAVDQEMTSPSGTSSATGG